MLKAFWFEVWLQTDLLDIRPFYFKTKFPNYDVYEKYDYEDFGTEEDLKSCFGFYTDLDIAPVHTYIKGSFGSCMVAFMDKIWNREEELKIHCGFDDGTIIESRKLLIFEGYRAQWTIWEWCDWL